MCEHWYPTSNDGNYKDEASLFTLVVAISVGNHRIINLGTFKKDFSHGLHFPAQTSVRLHSSLCVCVTGKEADTYQASCRALHSPQANLLPQTLFWSVILSTQLGSLWGYKVGKKFC